MGTATYYGVVQQSDTLSLQGNPTAGSSARGGWVVRVKHSGGIVIDDPGPASYNDVAHGLFAGAWQLLLPDPNGPTWRRGMPWGLLGDTQGHEVSTYSTLSKNGFYFKDGLQWDTVLRAVGASGRAVLLGTGGLSAPVASTMAISDFGVGIGIRAPSSYNGITPTNTTPVFELHHKGSGSQPALTISTDQVASGQSLGAVMFASSATAQSDKRGAGWASALTADSGSAMSADLRAYVSDAGTIQNLWRLTSQGHVITLGSDAAGRAPTLGPLQAGIASQTISGSDRRLRVTIVTGAFPAPTLGSVVAMVSFGTAYGAIPNIVLSAGGVAGTGVSGFAHVMASATGFNIVCLANLAASTTYKIDCLLEASA